jgi:regulator of protease activity HflC (stomatin/prohibitin superfamily)
MSLVGAEIIVHYKISDLLKYVQSAGDPNDHSRLQVIAERAVNAYFVTMDIDSLLARSRVARSGIDEPNEPIGEDLRSKIAADISDTQIEGVEILRVCLAGVHPPQKSAVALSFHKRISALQEKQSAIERAKRQRIETLATVAGTEDDAIRIYGAIIAYNDAKANHGVDSSEAKGKLIGINRMLVKARGTVAKKIYGARAHRWREALAARGRAERFQADLLAYRAAPEYYRVKRFMRVLAEGMKEARKVLVSTSGPHAPIIRLNLLEGPSGLGRLTPEP